MTCRPWVKLCFTLLFAFFSFAVSGNKNAEKKGVIDLFFFELCLPCGEGKYSPGSSNCTSKKNCQPGWCPNPENNCLGCPAGSFSNQTNATQCSICADGWVSKEENSTHCSPCKAAETSSSDHTYCTSCPPGQYNPSKGQPCKDCGPGTFSGRMSYNCTKCPAGTYNDQSQQSSCTPCGRGKYNENIGQKSASDCKDCPDGFYCPDEGTVSPKSCPKDHYCVDGCTNPKNCPLLFESGSEASSCKPSLVFYLLLTGSCILILFFAIVVWIGVLDLRRRKRLKNQVNRTANERLIPEPLPGPEYNGL